MPRSHGHKSELAFEFTTFSKLGETFMLLEKMEDTIIFSFTCFIASEKLYALIASTLALMKSSHMAKRVAY